MITRQCRTIIRTTVSGIAPDPFACPEKSGPLGQTGGFYSGYITRRCGRNKPKRTRENHLPSLTGPSIDFPGYPNVLLGNECSCPHPGRLPRGRSGRDPPDRLHEPVMEPKPSPLAHPRRLRWSLAVMGGAIACILLLSSAAPSRADIYRWEDGQGTVHFTDDVTKIPSQYRKGSTLLIREPPSSISRRHRFRLPPVDRRLRSPAMSATP